MAAEAAKHFQDRMENATVNTTNRDHQSSIIEALSLVEDNPTYHNSEARVTSLISIWTSVSDKAESLSDLYNIFHSLFRKTSLTILSAQWVTVNHALKRRMAKVLSQCSQVLGLLVDGSAHLCAVLVMAVYDPWGEPALRKVMGGEADINDSLVRDYLDLEPVELLLTRIESLAGAGYEEAALCLSKCCVKYSGDAIPEVEKKKHSRGYLQLTAREARRKAEVTESKKKEFLSWFLILLQRRGEIYQITKETSTLTCHEGVHLIRHVNETKLPEQLSLAETLSHVFLVRDLVFPSNYCCTKDLITLWCKTQVQQQRPLPEITASVQKLLVLYASTSAHFYLFVDVLWEEFGSLLFPFHLEMYIRGLTADLNYLEMARQAENHDAIKELECHIADAFTKLSTLFTSSYEVVARECILSAFSLKPTQERFDLLQALTERITSKKKLTVESYVGANRVSAGSDFHATFPKECKCGGRCSTPTEEVKILDDSCLHQQYVHPILHMQIRGIPYELMQDFVAILECFRSRMLNSTDDCEEMRKMCEEYLCRESIDKNTYSQPSCESADSEADSLSDEDEDISLQQTQKKLLEDSTDDSEILLAQNVHSKDVSELAPVLQAPFTKEISFVSSVFAKQKLKSLKKKRFLKEKTLKREFKRLFKLSNQTKNVGKDNTEFIKRKKKRKTKREKDREALFSRVQYKPLLENRKLQKKKSEYVPPPSARSSHQETEKHTISTSDINFGSVVNNNARVLLSRLTIADMEKSSVSVSSTNEGSNTSLKVGESSSQEATPVTRSSQLLASCISSPRNPVVVLSDILCNKSADALKIMTSNTLKSFKIPQKEENAQNNTGSIRLLFKKEISSKVKITKKTVDNSAQAGDGMEVCKDDKEKASVVHLQKSGTVTAPAAPFYSVSQVFQNKANSSSDVTYNNENKLGCIPHDMVKKQVSQVEVQQNGKSDEGVILEISKDYLKYQKLSSGVDGHITPTKNMNSPSMQNINETKSLVSSSSSGQNESVSERGGLFSSTTRVNLTEGKTVIPIPVNSLETVNLQHFSAETGQNKPPVSALKLELPSLMQNRGRVMTAKLVLPVNSLNSSNIQSLLKNAMGHSPNSSSGENSSQQTLTIPGMIIIRNNYSSGGTSSEENVRIETGQEALQSKNQKRLWTSVRNLHGSIEWRKVGQRSSNMGSGPQRSQPSKPCVAIMQVPQPLGLETTKCDQNPPVSTNDFQDSIVPVTKSLATQVGLSPVHHTSSFNSAEIPLNGNTFEIGGNSEIASSSSSLLDSPSLLPVLFRKAKVNTTGDSISFNDSPKLRPYRNFKQSNTLSTQTDPSIDDTAKSDHYTFRKVTTISRKTSKPQIVFAEKCITRTSLGVGENNTVDLKKCSCSPDCLQKPVSENSLNANLKTCSTIPQSHFCNNSPAYLQKTNTSFFLEDTSLNPTNKAGTESPSLKNNNDSDVLAAETVSPLLSNAEFSSHNKDEASQNRKDKVVQNNIMNNFSTSDAPEFTPPVKRKKGRPLKYKSLTNELTDESISYMTNLETATSCKIWQNESRSVETAQRNDFSTNELIEESCFEINEIIRKNGSEIENEVTSVSTPALEKENKESKTEQGEIFLPASNKCSDQSTTKLHSEFSSDIKQFEATDSFVCFICKRELSSENSLHRHMVLVHKKFDEPYSKKYMKHGNNSHKKKFKNKSCLRINLVQIQAKYSSSDKDVSSHQEKDSTHSSVFKVPSPSIYADKSYQAQIREISVKHSHLSHICLPPGSDVCCSSEEHVPVKEAKFKPLGGDSSSLPLFSCPDSEHPHSDCTYKHNYDDCSDAIHKSTESFLVDCSSKISQSYKKNCIRKVNNNSHSHLKEWEKLTTKTSHIDNYMPFPNSMKSQCNKDIDQNYLDGKKRTLRRCRLKVKSYCEESFAEGMAFVSYQDTNQKNFTSYCGNTCLDIPKRERHVSDFTRGRTHFNDAKKSLMVKRTCPCCEDMSFSKKCTVIVEDDCNSPVIRRPRTRSSILNT